MTNFTRLLLFIAGLFISNGLQAQLYVEVNAPESIAGPYSSDLANFGADLNTDIWTGDAVFVNDGTAAPTEGCEASTIDLTGKIALIDRGSCEFGTKCLRAEEAGAIGAIVFNNDPGAGTIAMGAGVEGPNVTIPCVMLSYEDGQLIRAELENNTVNITLGLQTLPNDLTTDLTQVLGAPQGVIPQSQITADNFPVPVGALVTNAGFNESFNPTLEAVIEFTPLGGSATEIYNETASLSSIVPDSTEFIDLPDFALDSDAELGTFQLSYQVTSDSIDADPNNNAFSSSFTVSENVFVKGGWDAANNRPAQTSSFTIAGGGPIEFIAPFEVPNGYADPATEMGGTLDSVIFYVSTGLDNLSGLTIECFVYEWIDLNEDSTMNTGELEVVAFASQVFADDFPDNNAWLRLPLLDIIEFEEGFTIPGDDKVYAVGVRYQGADQVFFGFDDNTDLTQYIDFVTANGMYTDAKLPYIGVNTWTDVEPDVDGGFLFNGLRAAVATGLVFTPPSLLSSTNDFVGSDVIDVAVFPNPANEVLNVSVSLKEQSQYIRYEISDAAGRLIGTIEKEGISTDNTILNTSDLPEGNYYLSIRTEAGFTTKPFLIQR